MLPVEEKKKQSLYALRCKIRKQSNWGADLFRKNAVKSSHGLLSVAGPAC